MIRTFLAIALLLATPADTIADELRVMTFNIWHGGDAGGQPLSQTVRAIRQSDADIVGLQETHGHAVAGARPDNGRRIAELLGWHYWQQGGRTGILSRFPLGEKSKGHWGVEIECATGKRLMIFNVHFAPAPYQPYQVLKIPYGDAPFIESQEEVIEWANKARGAQVDRLLEDMREAIEAKVPIVVTGDFNEPSFQDWTERARKSELVPMAVDYPATKRLTSAGFTDAWRAVYPSEIKEPGWTWTPTTLPDDPMDRHDRIDFVFVRNDVIEVTRCERVGEAMHSRITVEPWPSDHRAVVATIRLP